MIIKKKKKERKKVLIKILIPMCFVRSDNFTDKTAILSHNMLTSSGEIDAFSTHSAMESLRSIISLNSSAMVCVSALSDPRKSGSFFSMNEMTKPIPNETLLIIFPICCTSAILLLFAVFVVTVHNL